MEISCVLGRRRHRGWCLVLVQSMGLSDSRFHAFLSFPKQSRPIYPPARPYPGTISIIDQISDAIRPEDPYDIEVKREPLVRAHLPPLPDPPPSPPGEKAMEVDRCSSRWGQQRHRVYRRDTASIQVPDLHLGPAPTQHSRQGCQAVPWRHWGVYIISMAPASSWMWLWGKPATASTHLLQAPAATRWAPGPPGGCLNRSSETASMPPPPRWCRPGSRISSPPQAIVRHKTPRPREEEQVRRLQTLRAIRNNGSFRTTWNCGGSFFLENLRTLAIPFTDTSFLCPRECHLR